MKDITNHINNIGKPLDDVKLTVELTLAELDEIISCADYVLSDGHDAERLVKLCEDARSILDRYEGR